MNFNEARRFLRLDKPTAAIRMAAAISHRRVALRYEAEQRDNPDAYDLRTMKPLGTIQSAIANANLARAYGNEASDFFEQSVTGIRLTSPSFLSLTDERIEYGTRQIKDKNGNFYLKDFVNVMKSQGYKSPDTYIWRYCKNGRIKKIKRAYYKIL